MRSRDGGTTPSPASATRRTYTGQYDIGFWAGAIQHYNARQYDYVLGRFLQPDTVTADPGNPHDLNRYMYVRGNPTNLNDPTGHIANILIGAGIGAAIGFGLYAWNEAMNGNGLQWSDWQDGLVAAGTGAVAGGLIGSGIGAAGGVAMLTGASASVAVGAGSGMAGALLSDHLSNLANGQDFNAVEHVTTGAFGLATGAVGMAPGFTLPGKIVIGATLGTVEAAVIAGRQGQEYGLDEFAGAAVRGGGSMWLGEAIGVGFGGDVPLPLSGGATMVSTNMFNALYDPSTNEWGYNPEYVPSCHGRRCNEQ